MARELHVGEFHGTLTDGGYVVGFDYGLQRWIDTRPTTPRDRAYSLGSASNPISTLPAEIRNAVSPKPPAFKTCVDCNGASFTALNVKVSPNFPE